MTVPNIDTSDAASRPVSVEPVNFLDMDLYKLLNQCAIHTYYPDLDVEWKFASMSPELVLSKDQYNYIKRKLHGLQYVTPRKAEVDFLREQCPFFPQHYLEYLAAFRYDTATLNLQFDPVDNDTDTEAGKIEITVKGNWRQTTLFECPILQTVAEACYQTHEWNDEDQEKKAYATGLSCFKQGVKLAEFGSRRRRSLRQQERVVHGLLRAHSELVNTAFVGCFLGTSNVHLSRQSGLKPLSTMSHEWFMGVGAHLGDYQRSSAVAMSQWIQLYGPWFQHDDVFGLALPDTFGSQHFFDAFQHPIGCELGPETQHEGGNVPLHRTFTGLRCDSGDPIEFIGLAKNLYMRCGATRTPTLMFSDSMTTPLCIKYTKAATESGFRTACAMGSYLMNNFPDNLPSPNIVFKLHNVAGNPAVKLSDDPSRGIGDSETIKKIMQPK